VNAPDYRIKVSPVAIIITYRRREMRSSDKSVCHKRPTSHYINFYFLWHLYFHR